MAKADETALMPLALQGWCFASPKGKSPARHYDSLSLISSQTQELYCHGGHVCLGHTFRKATEKKVKIMCCINVGLLCAVLGTPPPAQAQGANGFNRDMGKVTKQLYYWLLNLKV